MKCWISRGLIVASFLALYSDAPLVAQGGAAIVRIPISDGVSTRCIDASKDQVWFTLRRVITDKKSNWMTQDAKTEMIFSAQVLPSNGGKPTKYPLTTEATLAGFSSGQVSIPVEYTLLSGFLLKQDATMYSGLNVEVTLLNLQKKTIWGNALQAFIEYAKKLPLPSTPLVQASTYVLDFANAAVERDIAKVGVDDQAKSAALALNFAPNSTCSGKAPNGSDFEKTGTIAIVQDKGDASGLLVNLKSFNDFCWSADLTPVFMLKAAKKDGTTCDDNKHYAPKYSQVTNNYVAFFLNAVERSGQLAETPQSKADSAAARSRCLANGFVGSKCM